MQQRNCKLVLEDGSVYAGYSFGSARPRVTELVFNTAPVGYQEILSDPSYTDQTVVMAYPLIGNYGMNPQDYETRVPTIGGFAVREYNDHPSNFRCNETLATVMARYDIAGISGIDTRKLVRSIRNDGCRLALLTDVETPMAECLTQLSAYQPPHDAVARVSRKNFEHYPAAQPRYHVVAVDCGMKQNIVRCLNARGCDVTIVPWDTSAETVLALHPAGIFLSNGPGDPTDAIPVIELVRRIRGMVPMFGICLGHQILSLAYGASTYKLKFGHRGGNHPVLRTADGKIEITSQNHSYAVDAQSIAETPLTITHTNILDGTVEGVECAAELAFSVQFHPESFPGPQDSAALFDKFLAWMEVGKHAETH